MYSVSDQFTTYINRSGRRKVTVDLQLDLAVLAQSIPVISGSLTYDRQARIPSYGTFMLAPEFDLELLKPYGVHLYVKAGVVFPDGSEELVPMGRFHIEDLSFAEGTDIPTVTVFDRLKVFDDIDGWEGDLSGRWGADWIINEARPFAFPYGDLPYTWDIVDYRLPGGSIYSGSNLSTMLDIVQNAPAFAGIPAGGEIWMDRNGGLVIDHIDPITSSTTLNDAVAVYAVGMNIISCERSVTRDGVYNAIHVEIAPDSNGYRPLILAFDDDPTSKTYYHGTFGRKIKGLSRPRVTSVSDGLSIAQRELDKVLGLAYGVTFEAPFNPALDIGDIVALFFYDDIELHQIDSINVDFPSWVMRCETRSIRQG